MPRKSKSSVERVLVTGGTGSIGSRLAQRLADAGKLVRLLVRDPARLGNLVLSEGMEVVPGDLGRPETLTGCMQGCTVVYHCAAKLTGSDWGRFRAINVEGTKALLQEARRAGVKRFVHASTIGVYGCSNAQDITEDFPWPKEDYPYFITKQEAEQAVWDAAADVPIVVARLGDVFGPGQYVWTIDPIKKIQQGILPPLVDRDSGMFNPVYIGNALDALLLTGGHPAALGQAFNIVDGTPISFSDYIRRLSRMAGRRPLALPGIVLKAGSSLLMGFDLLRGREASVKPADVDYLMHKGTISGQKIRSVLGWRPVVSQEDAFCRTEEWLRQAGYLQ